MYKLRTGRTMPGALGLMSGTVFAAAEDQPNASVLYTAELSLYATPTQKLRYVEAETGQLEQGVGTIRKIAKPYATWFQGAYEKVKPKVDSLIQFGNESYTYLNNPPAEFYPRTGVIGLAAFLGLFLARGSRVKKLIYPTGLVAVGASLYYPQQAAAVATSTGASVYDLMLRGYVAMEKVLKTGSKPAVEKPAKEKQEKNDTAADDDA